MESAQLNTLLDFQADLDWAIAEGRWKDGYEIIFAVKDYGYEHEAKIMLDSLIRAQKQAIERGPKTRDELVQEYGEEKVEWAEKLVNSDDHRDYMDRHYP